MESTTWHPKSGPEPIPVDFNWMPADDLVGLNTRGTEQELATRGIELSVGMFLNVWDMDTDDSGYRNDLIAQGRVERWQDIWVLRIEGGMHWQSEDAI